MVDQFKIKEEFQPKSSTYYFYKKKKVFLFNFHFYKKITNTVIENDIYFENKGYVFVFYHKNILVQELISQEYTSFFFTNLLHAMENATHSFFEKTPLIAFWSFKHLEEKKEKKEEKEEKEEDFFLLPDYESYKYAYVKNETLKITISDILYFFNNFYNIKYNYLRLRYLLIKPEEITYTYLIKAKKILT